MVHGLAHMQFIQKFVIFSFAFFFSFIHSVKFHFPFLFHPIIKITSEKSDAAYMASIFWACLAVGRVVAIPLAIYISATNMLRIQLVQSGWSLSLLFVF